MFSAGITGSFSFHIVQKMALLGLESNSFTGTFGVNDEYDIGSYGAGPHSETAEPST